MAALLIGIPSLILLLILLYRNGYIPIRVMRALLFVGSTGIRQNQCKARFSVCTGFIRYVLTFREAKTVLFSFDSAITKGNVQILVLDRTKQPVLKLTPDSPTGQLRITPHQRYYIKIIFNKADGDYHLTWH